MAARMRESRRRYIHLSSSNDACLRTLFRWKTHRLRQRKVRCNQAVPCATCRKRGHEHLCRYGKLEGTEGQAWRPGEGTQQRFVVYAPGVTPSSDTTTLQNGRGAYSGSTSSDTIEPLPVLQAESAINDVVDGVDDLGGPAPATVTPLPPDQRIIFLDSVAAHEAESLEIDPENGQTTYMGRNASANFFRSIASVCDHDVLPSDVSLESAFSLTNRVPLHPFGSLWTTVGVTLFDILQTLSNPEECMMYYRNYQHTAQPYYSFLLDPSQLERRFGDFLQNLGEGGIDPNLEQTLREATFTDASWYGLMVAVLASGCQFSGDIEDRQLRTRVLVVCAFECLRLGGLYVRPSVEILQTLLVLQCTIANDSNPGVAIQLLGNTPCLLVKGHGLTVVGLITQQAQALGLHLKQETVAADDSIATGTHPLWKAVMFMDSTLSSAFDRRPLSFIPPGCSILCHTVLPAGCPFNDIMHALHTLRLDWQTTLSRNHENSVGVDLTLAALDSIDQGLERMAQDQFSLQSRLDRHTYTIHAADFRAQLIRWHCLSSQPSRERRQRHLENLQAELRNVVHAFVALKQLSPIALIAWDILHKAVSAGLLLGALDKALGTSASREILERLRRAFPPCKGKVQHEEPEMAIAPFYHGLEAVEWIVR